MTRGKKRANTTTMTIEIRSEEDLDKATEELCELMSLGSAMSPVEAERFRLLTEAAEEYEAVQHPIPEPSHSALLEHLLEARQITPAQLAKATGVPRLIILDVLKGSRQICRKEARVFARYFHVEESVFVEQTPRELIRAYLTNAGTASWRVPNPLHGGVVRTTSLARSAG